MDNIAALGVVDNTIEFRNANDIIKVMKLLDNGENFIISHMNAKGVRVSKLMLATDLLAKVKNGEVLLLAQEVTA